MDENRKVFGYTFSDVGHLEKALTHASFSNEEGLDYSNERLEFLGDAVLQLAVTHYLWQSYPDDSEGDLSRKRAKLVCEKTLADWSFEMQLDSRIRLGKGLARSGGRRSPSILADAAEAVIGAIYLDGGFETASRIIFRFCRSREFLLSKNEGNPKVILQERLESQGRTRPVYRLVKTEGPAHEPLHTVEVVLDGKILARATGKTVRDAETRAAELSLEEI